MDGLLIILWIVRLLFLALLYVFLFRVVRALVGDLRSAARAPMDELGRLVVVESPAGEPPVGMSFALDAITTLGRDVNNTIVVDDPFATGDHATLTYRGRTWFIEDHGSTNGTYVNGHRVGEVSALGFGDDIQVGQVRLRLDRPRR